MVNCKIQQIFLAGYHPDFFETQISNSHFQTWTKLKKLKKTNFFFEKTKKNFRPLFDLYFNLFLTFIIHTAMFNSKYEDPFWEDEINNKQDPEEESWDNIPEGGDIPERIEWLEEVDGGELDDYSFENDLDDFDLDDV